MKKTNGVLLLIICLALTLSTVSVAVLAEGESNFDFKLSKTALATGETFSVSLTSDEMTVSSIVCGIMFDNDKLSCISIVGSDPEFPDEVGIDRSDGKSTWVKSHFIPSVDEANESGSVGAVFVSEDDVSYVSGEVFTATFLAKAAGETEITLYEDTDGADGYRSDNAKSMQVLVYDANAADDANVYFNTDKNELAVGERVSVTLYSKEMTVATFSAGISFDKEKLRCVSIVGSDPQYPNDFGLNKKEGKSTWTEAMVTSTVEDANATGDIGMLIVSTDEETYAEGAVFTATFEAIAEGEALISLFEDSDGADGYRSDCIAIGSVNIGGKKLSVRSTSDSIGYSVSGNVVTVKCDDACKAGYLKDGAYIEIDATEGTDGYSFAAPEDVYEVLLTLNGDSNLDGRVTAADIARINAHKLGKTAIGADELFAGDVNGDGLITDADIAAIKDSVLRITPLGW